MLLKPMSQLIAIVSSPFCQALRCWFDFEAKTWFLTGFPSATFQAFVTPVCEDQRVPPISLVTVGPLLLGLWDFVFILDFSLYFVTLLSLVRVLLFLFSVSLTYLPGLTPFAVSK